MQTWIDAFAKDIGAQVIAEIPNSGAGPFDAGHAAGFYSRRMAELRGEAMTETHSGKFSIPLDESTYQGLESAAQIMWPGQKIETVRFGSDLLRGLTLLILDQLTRRLDEKKQRLRDSMDAKDAITAAVKEMLDVTVPRSKAG